MATAAIATVVESAAIAVMDVTAAIAPERESENSNKERTRAKGACAFLYVDRHAWSLCTDCVKDAL